MTPERLREMQRLDNKAAPGPWFAEEIGEAGLTIVDDGRIGGLFSFQCETFEAKFCAHARAFVPEAIAEIRRLQKRVEELRLRSSSA